MHDPNSLAFHLPWLFDMEIWHVDPCKDGDDDSAGYITPRLNMVHLARAVRVADEWKHHLPPHPWAHEWSAVEFLRIIWSRIKWQELSTHEVSKGEMALIWSLATNPADNLRGGVSGSMTGDREEIIRFVMNVYRQFLRYHRPWYRHPKWNVTRWRILIRKLGIEFGQKAGDVWTDW